MARYFIPSASLPAIYGVYKTWSKPRSIHTINDAVEALNEHRDIEESVQFMQRCKDKSFLNSLSPAALGILARCGSKLCQQVPVKSCLLENYDFEKALRSFNLGDEWNSSLEWLNRVACPEEDLSCSEEWLVRRPSQIERLRRMLQLLFLKTEKTFDTNLVAVEVVSFLYNAHAEFFESHPDIGILALKIMANICRDAKYASAMLTSEWLTRVAWLVHSGKNLLDRLLSHKICQNSLNALGVINYKLDSDIFELLASEKEPEADIVMIHGLRGSVAYTWRQKDSDKNLLTSCWPKDWLPLDIRNSFRIIGLDYPSYLIQFTGTLESIQARADRFKDQLINAGVGRRPVIFICHSMGGLLAKRLLLDMPELREQTVGILFIGTPHLGSPIASWGYSVLHPSYDVTFLNENNPFNRQLNQDFAEISSNFPVIVSMVETKESNLIGSAKGIIVPISSAVFGQGAVYHIEEVHYNICKPSERSSPSYGVILNFLRDSFQEASRRTL